MEPKEVEKVFEPFVQLHPGTDKAQLGTGLGLTLVRNLVEMHGGRIVLKSAPGEGTTAFVRFPPARIAPRGATAAGQRSEERRVGKDGVSTCRVRGAA